MNLGKAISWADINLNSVTTAPTGAPTSGYRVDRIEVSPPPLTQYVEKRALTDGMVAHDVYLGGRTITAIVTAYGTSAGDFWDKAQALHRVMNAPLRRIVAEDNDLENTEGFGFLSFYQPTNSTAVGQWPTSAYPDGIPLAYRVRPLDMAYSLERSRDASESDEGQSKSFALRWLAKDPLKVHTSYYTANISNSGTLSATAYRGDYPSLPIFQWTQSASGSGTFSINVDGFVNSISVPGSGDATFPSTWYFDYNRRTLTIGDPDDSASTLRNDRLSTLGGFVPIRASSVITMTGMSGFASQQATLKVYETFS